MYMYLSIIDVSFCNKKMKNANMLNMYRCICSQTKSRSQWLFILLIEYLACFTLISFPSGSTTSVTQTSHVITENIVQAVSNTPLCTVYTVPTPVTHCKDQYSKIFRDYTFARHHLSLIFKHNIYSVNKLTHITNSPCPSRLAFKAIPVLYVTRVISTVVGAEHITVDAINLMHCTTFFVN